MLESKAEQFTLRSGTFLADQLGYWRINLELLKDSRSYIKENSIPASESLAAAWDALKFSLKDPWQLLSFPSYLLYRLTLGKLEPGLVSEVAYWRHLHRVWGSKSRNVSDVKTLTRKLLDSDALPDLGYFVKGNYFDKNWNHVGQSDLIGTLGNSQIVVKRDYSERGRHVITMSPEELSNFDSKDFGDFVVQRKIQQHDFFTSFGNGNLMTLRLLTAFPDGNARPEVVSGLVKSDADPKSHVFLRIVIDPSTGRFVGFGINARWGRVPLENLGLSQSLEIPGLAAAKELVLQLHAKFPHFQLIGWDLGIDESGKPWIFEWNADHPGIVFHQSVLGPILAKAGLDLKAKAK